LRYRSYAWAAIFRFAAGWAIKARSLTIAGDISCVTSRALIGSSQWARFENFNKKPVG
jgi:hypothetical protein